MLGNPPLRGRVTSTRRSSEECFRVGLVREFVYPRLRDDPIHVENRDSLAAQLRMLVYVRDSGIVKCEHV